MMLLPEVSRSFLTRSKHREHALVRSAPGRVNLLGEHTDYTGGLVLPIAIPFATEARIEPNFEGDYVFTSNAFSSVCRVAIQDDTAPTGEWNDYPVGVLKELQKLGIEPPPFRLHLSGDVPQGAGLSSSASIEIASCLALLAWGDVELPMKEIALLCQRAENLYVGAPCGIMDQFVIAAARRGKALLLNTRDLEFELLPMDRDQLADTRIVICNSQVKHSVASGEYGTIRKQMLAGQAVLVERYPDIKDLGMASLEQLQGVKEQMPIESYARCRHVISENERVLAAKQALLDGNVTTLGQLMTEGHISQRDDLGTSCTEVDFLVDTAIRLPGCFGARMTGGGFGGCTVNLVARNSAESFANALVEAYRAHEGLEAQIYFCSPEDGAIAANKTANPMRDSHQIHDAIEKL